jgi:hypothetical protein
MSDGRSSCGPVFFLMSDALRLATVLLRLRLEAREMECASYCDMAGTCGVVGEGCGMEACAGGRVRAQGMDVVQRQERWLRGVA